MEFPPCYSIIITLMLLSRLPFFIVILILIILSISIFLYFKNSPSSQSTSPKPSPTEVQLEKKTKVKYPEDHTIVLAGDSMTEGMGNSDELRRFLKNYYPDKTFEVLNYGFGSTNILSLQERLTEKTFHGREFRPVTDIDFNLIAIESFGHNPLSQYPLDEGLKMQTEALKSAIQTIKTENPKAKILFVATLAPSRKHYGRNNVDLSTEQRKNWAEERIAYIKNHIQFAIDNNIPVVNIFNASQNKDGEVNLDYINKTDYIHPSPTGIVFISQQIADFIYQNKLLE